MKLRTRLAVTLGVATVTVLIVLGWAGVRLQLGIRLEAVAEAMVHRMESGGRDRCESAPSEWPAEHERRHGYGGPEGGPPLGGPPPGPPFGRPGRRGYFGVPRIFAYDASLVSANPNSPPFPEDLREELQDGDDVAATRIFRKGDAQIAVRMPWTDGPCAVLLLQTKGPPAWFSQAMLVPPILVTLVVILVSLVVAAPVVRRVRRLTEAVERNEPIVAEGNDEIAELGRAFDRSRRTIEEQLQSLREREAALRNYIANTSHDVMLPLSVLQGHLVALQQQMESNEPLGPEALVPSLEESQYLGSLLHNLNAAARLEADPGLTHREAIDLNRLVMRVVERHRPVARRKQIALDWSAPERTLTFKGDVTLLEQALGNVVHNAVRYNDSGGHVAVTLDGHDEAWVIRVADDGPGIPEADRQRVFEPSFRGSEARTRHPHGMGLGLHIASDVAKRHRLRLELSETEGGGLTVTLTPSASGEPDT